MNKINFKIESKINAKIINLVIPYFIDSSENSLYTYLSHYLKIKNTSNNKKLLSEIETNLKKTDTEEPNPISIYINIDGSNYHLFLVGIRVKKSNAKGLSSKVKNGSKRNNELGELLDIIRSSGAEVAINLGANNVVSVNVGLITHLSLNVNEKLNNAFLEGFLLSLYKFDKYKQESTDKTSELKNVVLVFPNTNKSELKQQNKNFEELFVRIKSIYLARDLVNEPGNILSSTEFINVVKNFAKLHKIPIEIEVWNKDRLKKEGMNLIVSVGEGSLPDFQSRLMILKYNPKSSRRKSKQLSIKSSKKTKKNIKNIKNIKKISQLSTKSSRFNPAYVLVGKGVTFDTGGINLKPADSMNEMKSDMAGAAIISSFILGYAKLNGKQKIMAFVPLAENNLGKGATRPGDVIKSHNGKTVEIIDTDAEGRLLLADCLSYVSDNYSKSKVIDIATLTGDQAAFSCKLFSNVMSRHPRFANYIVETGNYIQENIVKIPYMEKYKKFIDSETADLRNVSMSCNSELMVSGVFLGEFVAENVEWAHLDIAGSSWDISDEIKYAPGEGSGVGVRLLFGLIE